VNVAARSNLLGLRHPELTLGARGSLREQHDGARPALADEGEVALDAPEVEVAVEPREHEREIDVGGDDLRLGSKAGGAAHETCSPRQHREDRPAVREHHPIAGRGRALAGLERPRNDRDALAHLPERGDLTALGADDPSSGAAGPPARCEGLCLRVGEAEVFEPHDALRSRAFVPARS
jgi:hypothetical protein